MKKPEIEKIRAIIDAGLLLVEKLDYDISDDVSDIFYDIIYDITSYIETVEDDQND